MHFSRPLYEGLPWLYIALGLGGIATSYFLAAPRALGVIAGIAGLAALLAGVVILLRRRDFRELGRRYAAGRDDAAAGLEERSERDADQD